MPKVLVVDDNEFNLRLVSELLQAHGLEVREARSGQEALDLARAEPLDAVLMDISLRGDMDGLDATRALKADPQTAGLPVIALTAYAMREDRERALAAGCAGFIAKPIETRALAATVLSYIQAPPGEGESHG